MENDTLTAPAEGTSSQPDTASVEQAAPETADQGEDVAKLKHEAEVARQEARYQALARKVDVNEFQFRDVFAADRKAAARIAKEKWGITPEEVLAQLSASERASSGEEAPAVANTATDFDAWYARKREAEEAEGAKEAAFAALKLDPESRAKVEQEFAWMAQGKRLDASAARKLVVAAYHAVNADAVAGVESARRSVSSIVTAGQSAVQAAPSVDPVKSEIQSWKATRESSFHKNWYKKA